MTGLFIRVWSFHYAMESLFWYGTFNPWRACAARVTVVVLCVCVCLSTQHLTSPTFICATNDITYFTVDEDQKICAVFSENSLLFTAEKSAIFVCQGTIIRVRVHFTCNPYARAFMRNYRCVFPHVYTRRAPRVPHFSAFH